MFIPMPLVQQGAFSLAERQTEIVLDGRGEIYGSRQSLGMQGRDWQGCFHIIVPSSSSLLLSFVALFFLYTCFFLVCVSLCACVGQIHRLSGRHYEWQGRDNTKGNMDTSAIEVRKREEEQQGSL